MFSHWEKKYYDSQNSIVIVGGGIVGLSTAISIKEIDKNQNVIVLERNFPPVGASTKNAGFLCFGSLTELEDDLKSMSRSDCIDLIKMRWEGGQKLITRLSSKKIDFDICGGFEVFNEGHFPDENAIEKANDIFDLALGIKGYFKSVDQSDFPAFGKKALLMDQEGEIDPMKMMIALYQLAHEKGVKFIFGKSVGSIDQNCLKFLNGEKLTTQKIIVCTNGFASKLYPSLKIIGVRNQVLTTAPLEGINWAGVYHFDKGYYYFRKVGDRILLGGGRNAALKAETTIKFGNTTQIKNLLSDFLENKLNQNPKKIETWWSGILGVGDSKFPIVKFISKHTLIGVRLGGMGVAIGSYLGEQLAIKILNDN